MNMIATGKLIEMNTRLVRTNAAIGLIVAGCVGVVCCAYLIMAALCSVRKRRVAMVTFLSILMAIFLGALIWGISMPKDKVIHACADGPVSLEEIAVAYDILEIDGKELTLRVR